jgi:hypothetical protein
MMPPQHKAPKVFYSNGVEGLHAVSRRVLELTNESSVPGSPFQYMRIISYKTMKSCRFKREEGRM